MRPGSSSSAATGIDALVVRVDAKAPGDADAGIRAALDHFGRRWVSRAGSLACQNPACSRLPKTSYVVLRVCEPVVFVASSPFAVY